MGGVAGAVTRAEQGPEAAAEVAHALRLLQERGDRHAAFWACPPCDAAFPSSVEFNEHLYAYHEEAVYADEASGRYLICSHCSQEARLVPPLSHTPTRSQSRPHALGSLADPCSKECSFAGITSGVSAHLQ